MFTSLSWHHLSSTFLSRVSYQTRFHPKTIMQIWIFSVVFSIMCDSHRPNKFWAQSGVTWAIVEGSCDNHKTRWEVTWRETKLSVCNLCHSHMIGGPIWAFHGFQGFVQVLWVTQECFIQREKLQPPNQSVQRLIMASVLLGDILQFIQRNQSANN
jgi:hypothetical protein